MSEKPRVEQWSVRRWKQLEQLERLLKECQAIDRGAPVISRLQWLIKVSTELDRFDHKRQRFSFLQFLKDQALEGFEKRRKK